LFARISKFFAELLIMLERPT